MRPDARVADGGPDLGEADLLARLGLLRVVVDDTGGEDVALALVEVLELGEEEGRRTEGRGWQEEDEKECDEDGEQTLNEKEPAGRESTPAL